MLTTNIIPGIYAATWEKENVKLRNISSPHNISLSFVQWKKGPITALGE
jgi:hypothetical protein